MTEATGQPAEAAATPKPKRPRAKKIKGNALGPYQTACTTFERGREREIEIVSISPFAITYRIKGFEQEYTLPHEIAFMKALSVKTSVDTGPRTGRIKRG